MSTLTTPAPDQTSTTSGPIRLLISAQGDLRLLEQVTGALEAAVERYPDTFDKVTDKPNIVDHYGFHTDVLSTTVLVEEYPGVGNYYRLTIRPGEHVVFDNLTAIVRDHFQL